MVVAVGVVRDRRSALEVGILLDMETEKEGIKDYSQINGLDI